MLDLFDIRFKKFVAPAIVKIVYGLLLVGITVGYLVITIVSFNDDVVLGIVVALVLGPLLGLFYVCLYRVMLEGIIALITTAQNTAELVRLQQGPPPVSPSPVPAPGPDFGPQSPPGGPYVSPQYPQGFNVPGRPQSPPEGL